MRKGSVVTPLTLGFSIMVLLTSVLLLVSLVGGDVLRV